MSLLSLYGTSHFVLLPFLKTPMFRFYVMGSWQKNYGQDIVNMIPPPPVLSKVGFIGQNGAEQGVRKDKSHVRLGRQIHSDADMY